MNNRAHCNSQEKFQLELATMLKSIALFCIIISLFIFPSLFTDASYISIYCNIAIMAVFALSYNVLLGQAGMLSFGHAVFYGIGAFLTAHFMNWAESWNSPWVPLAAVPLVGGLGSLALGIPIGYLSSARTGTIFAMITLGLAELVSASTPIFDGFFGGEPGISTDRSLLLPVFGMDFGRQNQAVYVIVLWAIISASCMYYLTRTPVGQLARAIRENPERAEFVGADAQKVRFIVFAVAAFFAGISGGMAVINFEIVTADSLSSLQSAMVVLTTYIGGVGYFLGPVVGAFVITLCQSMLSDLTPAWQLYLGLTFVAVVLFLPGGLAAFPSVLRRSDLRREKFLLGFAVLLFVAGLVLSIEMGYRVGSASLAGPAKLPFGLMIDGKSVAVWSLAAALLALGLIGVWRFQDRGVSHD